MLQATGLDVLAAAIPIVLLTAAAALGLAWAWASMRASLRTRSSASSTRIRVRIPRRPRPLALCRSSFIGLSLALAFPPAVAKASRSPLRDGAPAQQPWRQADGQPPPHPSAGVEVQRDETELSVRAEGSHPPWRESDADGAHPAIHGSRKASVHPLFPRAGNGDETEPRIRKESSDRFRRTEQPGQGDERASNVMIASEEPAPRFRGSDPSSCNGRSRDRVLAEKRACMRRHPAGKGIRPSEPVGRNQSARKHVVKPGESLWSIAAVALDTDDQARIARYWPRIHRANRDVIGSDPNLIYPNQTLSLPRESRS